MFKWEDIACIEKAELLDKKGFYDMKKCPSLYLFIYLFGYYREVPRLGVESEL